MKETVVRMRVDKRQKDWWMKSLQALGIAPGERSDYIRQAIDRAISQDFRSKDPKWQKFINAVQKQAAKHLGYGLSDNFDDRQSVYKALWKVKKG